MKLDLEQASRDELKQLVLQLLTRLQALEERNKELEAENECLRRQVNNQKPPSFLKANRKKPEKKPRKKRLEGFARKLDNADDKSEGGDCLALY